MKFHAFRDLHDFSAHAPELVATATRALQGAGVDVLSERYMVVLKALTPVGGSLARDRHPGLMKRSWARKPRGDDGKRALALNTAAHAAVINRGRRRGKPVGDKKPPLRGSRQAPRGVTRPAWRMVKRQELAISAEAIRRADL